MKGKFKRDNLVTVVRILTLRQRICEYNAIWSLLVMDREAARAEAASLTHCLELISQNLGIGYELYGDEEDIALHMAREEGVEINYE